MHRLQGIVGAALVLGAAVACTGGTSTSTPAAAARPAGSPAAGATPDIDGKTPLPDPLPAVAAKVNGQAIPTQNVKLLAERALQTGQVPPDQKPFAYRQALQRFIVRELLLQEATARGLAADQAQLEQAENAERAHFKDAAAWQASLAAQGMTEAAYKTELRVQYTVNALVQQLHADVPAASVTDDELKRYYDEHPQEFTARDRVRAAHILIRVPAGAAAAGKASLRNKAEGLLAEIRAGGDFASLARQHSDDPASGPRGGEMEVFGRGQMGPDLATLEQAIYALKPGDLGGVVETPAGYHIVKLVEKLPDEAVPLDGIKEQLRHHLLQQKRTAALHAFVETLRAKATIETYF